MVKKTKKKGNVPEGDVRLAVILAHGYKEHVRLVPSRTISNVPFHKFLV